METVKRSLSFNASKQDTWKVLADFGSPHKYVKGIVDSYLTSKVETGVGTVRHCDLPNMMGMKQFIDEEITDWKEGEEFTYVVTNTAAPIKNGVVTWRVSGDAHHSTIDVDIKYQLKGIMGILMKNKLSKEFNKQIAEGLQDIRDHLETQQNIAA